MTTLLHNAAVARVPLDPYRLYVGDRGYIAWLEMAVGEVAKTRRRQEEETKNPR